MRLSFFALAVLLVSVAPHAQVQQGLVELGGSASFHSIHYDTALGDDSRTVLRFSPAVGYFFTPSLEAGLRLDYLKLEDVDGSGDLLLFGAYHFGRYGATTVPFIEANLGTSLTDDSDLVFGGRGGAKFFFLPGGALTADAFVSTDGDVTRVGAEAGVSIFL